MDQYNKDLLTPEMIQAAEEAKQRIIAGADQGSGRDGAVMARRNQRAGLPASRKCSNSATSPNDSATCWPTTA